MLVNELAANLDVVLNTIKYIFLNIRIAFTLTAGLGIGRLGGASLQTFFGPLQNCPAEKLKKM